MQGSPPHTRGLQTLGDLPKPKSGITPAYAGITSAGTQGYPARQDHPRIRRDYANGQWVALLSVGSPPHTRGLLRLTAQIPDIDRITPAYAGITFGRGLHSQTCRDHPRIRGDYRVTLSDDSGNEGSPPHTRGLPRPALRPSPPGWITPAYAGITLSDPSCAALHRDHPRIRGDYSYFYQGIDWGWGSPPHTRGLQGGHELYVLVERITPAYAGITPGDQ